MKERLIARRYAKAFFTLAIEERDAEGYGRELARLNEAAKNTPVLLRALGDIEVPMPKRMHAVSLLADVIGLRPLTISFMKLLISKHRIALLSLIAERYHELLLHMERIAQATLTVAEESVVESAAERIRTILETLLGRRAICDVHVNRDLLGGFVVRVGDTVFDASVRGHLNQMKQELLS